MHEEQAVVAVHNVRTRSLAESGAPSCASGWQVAPSVLLLVLLIVVLVRGGLGHRGDDVSQHAREGGGEECRYASRS